MTLRAKGTAHNHFVPSTGGPSVGTVKPQKGQIMPALYMIKLNKGVERKNFIKFMVEEVFADIPKGATRAGRVTSLELWRGTNTSLEGFPDTGNQDEFLWIVEGFVSGVGERTLEKIAQYGAKVKDLGNFGEAGVWRSGGGAAGTT
jgi:hypothetical protein